MKHSRRSVATIAIVAALALAGISAASASAVPKWTQGETTMKWSAATITLEKGGEAASCSSPEMIGNPPLLGATGGGKGGVANYGWYARISCGGAAVFEFCACFQDGTKVETGVYTVNMNNRWSMAYPWYQSPWGKYGQGLGGSAKGTFVNGSEGTPSKLTFSKVTVGKLQVGYEPITLSGSFDVTTSKGGLLTLEG